MNVDYRLGENENPESYQSIDECLEKAVKVTQTAFKEYTNPAIMWMEEKIRR